MAALDIGHADRIVGKLVCFDRLIGKGHRTALFGTGRFQANVSSQGVLLKDIGRYVITVAEQLKAHAVAQASSAGRPYLYLAGANGDEVVPCSCRKGGPILVAGDSLVDVQVLGG